MGDRFVFKIISLVNGKIADLLKCKNAEDQTGIDRKTPNSARGFRSYL